MCTVFRDRPSNTLSLIHILVETLYTRAKLLTCAVLDLEKFVQR